MTIMLFVRVFLIVLLPFSLIWQWIERLFYFLIDERDVAEFKNAWNNPESTTLARWMRLYWNKK